MKTCLFTVTFAGFWGQHKLTLEDSIDKTAELGFEGIELMGKRPHLSPLDYSVDDCKHLGKRIKDKGLKCAAIGGSLATLEEYSKKFIEYMKQWN